MRVHVSFLLITAVNLVAQTSPSRPAFKDYSVKEIYRGSPAPPKLSKDQRMFRTMIRNGAKSPVEFAGHFTVPRFGCGTDCNEFYIVDSVSGEVYDGFAVVELPGSWEEKQRHPPERMEFHPDSRLLKINGCPNEKDCGFYDYVLVEGKGLKLIGKQLLPKEFQY